MCRRVHNYWENFCCWCCFFYAVTHKLKKKQTIQSKYQTVESIALSNSMLNTKNNARNLCSGGLESIPCALMLPTMCNAWLSIRQWNSNSTYISNYYQSLRQAWVRISSFSRIWYVRVCLFMLVFASTSYEWSYTHRIVMRNVYT